MTQNEYDNICRKNLHTKRENILRRVEKGSPSIDEVGMVFTAEYPKFLEYAAELDTALKLERWENADEISDTIIDMPPFRDNLRCVAIVGKLLEDYDV